MTADALSGLAIGIGLAAACGFRVFVPLFALSLAALGGRLPLSHGLEWIGTVPALIAFATATGLEVLAYKIPWLDNALDMLATPAAVFAGVVVSAAVMTDLPPVLRWCLALIAGGGAAGAVQGATVLMRLKSTLSTGGVANPVFATVELGMAIVSSFVSLVLPLLGLLILAGLCGFIFYTSRRFVFGRRSAP